MAVIRCPACGKPNPDFVVECQYCDTPLKKDAGAADQTLISQPGSTIRCQACGRMNPAEREVCQYCEARLRPLTAEAATGDTDPLARLRSTQVFTPPEGEAAPDAPETPDSQPPSWMSRLRGMGAAGTGDDTSEPEPDWMLTEAPEGVDEGPARLRDEPPPPADAPRTGGEELPEWLANLRASADAPPAPKAPPQTGESTDQPGSDDELPLWLQIEEPTPRPHLGGRPRKKMTDWMSSAPEGLPAQAAPEPPSQQRPPAPPAPEPPGAVPPAVPTSPAEAPTLVPPSRRPRKKMTDWMSSLPAGTSEQSAPGGEPPTPPASTPGEAAGTQAADQTLVPPSRPPRKKMTDWLTPAGSELPTPPATEPAESAEPEPDLPDWLKAMQPTEEVPDWLRDVAAAPRVFTRPLNPPETPVQSPASETAASDLGLPDWLKEAAAPKAEPTPPAEAESPVEAGSEAGTQALAETGPEALAEVAAPGAATPDAADDLPDWLQALRDNPPPAAEAGAVEAPAAGEPLMPDWLKDATGEPAESEPPPATPAADATLPWLAAAGTAEPEPEPEPEAEPAAAQPGEYELPDWLRPSPEAMAEADAELAAPPPVDPAAFHAAELAAAEDALPDWLRNLEPSAEDMPAELAPEAVAEAPSLPAADVPDWLRPAAPPASPPEPTEADVTLPAVEVPDWLQTLQAQAAEAPALSTTEPAADMPALDDETLAWLTATAASRGEQPTEATEAAAPAVPEWLDEFKAASVAPPAAEAMDAVPADEDLVAEPTAEADMPDWLRALRGVPTQEQQAAEAMPDWLRALRGIPPAPVTEVAGEAEAQADEAEDLAPAEPAVRVREPEEAEDGLPAWLAAMRPGEVEAPIEAEVDTYEENVGVLAGMRGVLRAEPTVAQPHRSTSPVQQLVVSDSHAKQAKLLTELMEVEAEVRPVAARPARTLVRYLERWLVFLALAVAILVPQFVLPGLFAAPATMRPEAAAAFAAVNDAPVAQPALVAFEYDPAQQGELTPGASAIVTHLMSRGVPVVAASTRPLGAAVAHTVLEQVAADLGARAQVSYTYGGQYLNLGYIPGGPVGLLQFAAAPRSVFNADFTGAGPASALWTQPILRGVEGLADFGLVVLVAADADDVRAWIEQTQAYAADSPRVAVVSAGAEPMVRPYFEAQTPQLNGLVAGLVGAAQYEQSAGLPGLASRHWEALGGGLWAAVLLIVGGNVIYAAAAALRRRRR